MYFEYLKIQKLIQDRSKLKTKLKLIPYEGSIEIKTRGENKYIYLRKKVDGKNTSTYLDVYSEELYKNITLLLEKSKEYKKEIKKINKELTKFGYEEQELNSRILLNVDFARANAKYIIYSQSILEGIKVTSFQVEAVLENYKINDMRANDILKIINLKRAWEFVLDLDIIASKSNYYMLCHIASLINAGFYNYGGAIRTVPVTITGANYIPPIPLEIDVKETIEKIVSREGDAIDIAIDLCLYCMKTQIFIDGNKRSSLIFANHYLVSQGGGLLIISEDRVPKFVKLLVTYYDGKDQGEIKKFMKNECWYRL
ncbi:MAG: Fic family protein [Bacilli bacterium]|jgi:prophage maintenance system killer protein